MGVKALILLSLIICIVAITLGCAHHPHPSSPASPAEVSAQQSAMAESREELPLPTSVNTTSQASEKLAGRQFRDDSGQGGRDGKTKAEPPPLQDVPAASTISTNNVADTGAYSDYVEEGVKEDKAGIADPLEPFNRAMYHFNDKLYFWLLKPVAQGYQKVAPERARVGVSNFFSNLATPVRFVNCLLQANLSGAAAELGRFLINTLWGIGGIMDPAASKDIDLAKQDEDFGQTLGVYGVGQGFYINWPLLGPSSPRDTVGRVGDFFLHPFTYLSTAWETSAGIRAYERVNATSLSIGDYEALKGAAIDPYVAIRDAYVQYRLKQVQAGRIKPEPASGKAP
jgi:phospholipid-binding lipoprotein MlaA